MSNIEVETHLPVEGLSGFVRDPSTRAIINVNGNEIRKAKAAKIAREQKELEVLNMKNDVTELKSDMQAIKLLLQQIAEK